MCLYCRPMGHARAVTLSVAGTVPAPTDRRV